MTLGPAPTLSLAAIAALQAGNKIAAIKIVRTETGMGLKDAKDLVDRYVAQDPVLQELLRANTGSGFFGWLFMLIVAIAAIVYFWPRS